MIPAITHQTAPSARLSDEQAELRARMMALNPGWEHRFYTDADCRDLIRRALPGLLAIYDAYPTGVQRADLFRIVAIYLFGGVYLDLDMACAAPLEALAGHGCVLAEERTLSVQDAVILGHAERLRIANYMFASAPRHPFWLDLLEEMVARAGRPVRWADDILESTGPGLLSTVYAQAAGAHPDIVVLPHPGRRCAQCGGEFCQFGTFAAHLHHGSWRGAVKPSKAAQAAPAPADPAPARRAIAALRRTGRAPADAYVLECYSGEPTDGLSGVHAMVKPLGQPIADSRGLTGETVLVAGIPYLYEDRLSPANYNVAYTTFETSALPRQWAEAINRSYQAVVVPHRHVREVFAASGVTRPIHLVAQGFSRPPSPPAPSPPAEAPRVGFLGVPVRRKNLQALYLACQSLRRRWPGLKLVVHVSAWYDWLDPTMWDAMRADPMVEWTEGPMSAEALGAWYRGLSCYAYPSRAEGWSFTPRESLFLGVPTLISDIPLHRELKQSGFCHVVRNRGREPATYEGGVFGDWMRIDARDIARTLAKVLSHPDAARRRAAAGAAWIEQRWFNADTQQALADILAAPPPSTAREPAAGRLATLDQVLALMADAVRWRRRGATVGAP